MAARRARSSSRASCRSWGSWARPRPQSMANGLPSLCSGCANSAGSRPATSRSSILAEGRNERYAASEFVRLKVDVIVTWGTAPVVAVKRATAVIPIVFTTAGDPVATGLVAGLARPGGNVTGLSNQTADLAGKRLELLREIIPDSISL